MRKIFFYITATLLSKSTISEKNFKIMKSSKFLLLLFIIIANLSTLTIRAQIVFYSDSTAILIKNNFIRDDNNVKYQPYDIKIPLKDFHFDVYGSQLKISGYSFDELMKKGGFSMSGSFRDTLKQDALFFYLANLQYSVTKNGNLETGWTPANAKQYADTINYKYLYKNKIYYRQGYLLYDGNLSNGDSVIISFRKETGVPFLNIHFKKLSALESSPFLMGSYESHDKDFPLEKFIQKSLENYQVRNTDFYDDWPGRSDNSNVKLFAETKTAYYFRPRTDLQNDSIFEYRLIVDKDESARWKKSDNIVFVTGLQAGNQYQLEVRYVDKPQYVYKKRFYVPGNWYQTIWFKAAIAFLFLLIALILFFFFKNKKQKRLQAEQKNKMKTLYAQLNPHFVFNALGSIQGLLNEGELEKANLYLSGFGSLLRSTLDNGEKNMISLQEELKNLNTYVTLEQLRRPFKYTQNIDETINMANVEMLPLFFQPIIENAIKHGWRSNNHQLNITLSTKKENDNLIINIQDNGKGFDTSKIQNGKGIKLIDERISLFNRVSKIKKIIKEIKSKDGTLVIIKFIKWLDDD